MYSLAGERIKKVLKIQPDHIRILINRKYRAYRALILVVGISFLYLFNGNVAYADAVYRGIVRFLTTDDPGAEPNQPEYFYDDAGTVSGDVCVVPEQP